MDAPVSEASTVRIHNVAILNELTQQGIGEDWYSPYFSKCQNVKYICGSVKEDIQKLDGVVRVYPTYTVSGVFHRELVFVICTDLNATMKKSDLPLAYSNLNVIFRNISNQCSENDYVVSSAEYRHTGGSQFNLDYMNKVLDDESDRLLKNHSNLMSIIPSTLKSTGYGKSNANLRKVNCIVFLLIAKGYVPLYEEMCPNQIKGCITDVREGQLQLYAPPCHRAKEYHQTLRMGCMISGGKQHQGTLGVFVHDNEKTYVITSAHVLLFGNANEYVRSHGSLEGLIDTYDDKVYQPLSASHVDTGAPIGRVVNAVCRTGDCSHAGVEVVLVELTDINRFPAAGNFPEGNFKDTGFTDGAPMAFNSGKMVDRTGSSLSRTEVLKFGSETGITRGLFKLKGKNVHRVIFKDNTQVVLKNQLEVLGTSECRFAAPGDSGALVLIPHQGNDKDLRALGIVTGGIGQGVCCVTPIWDVLEALDPKLKLKTFRPNASS